MHIKIVSKYIAVAVFALAIYVAGVHQSYALSLSGGSTSSDTNTSLSSTDSSSVSITTVVDPVKEEYCTNLWNQMDMLDQQIDAANAKAEQLEQQINDAVNNGDLNLASDLNKQLKTVKDDIDNLSDQHFNLVQAYELNCNDL
jgi:TolA-binding protein